MDSKKPFYLKTKSYSISVTVGQHYIENTAWESDYPSTIGNYKRIFCCMQAGHPGTYALAEYAYGRHVAYISAATMSSSVTILGLYGLSSLFG